MAKEFKLHQLLAAVGDRERQSTKLIEETIKVFDRDSHYDGELRTYEPVDEDANPIPDAHEEKKLVYSVKEKLDYVKDAVCNAVDSTLSKEETNSSGNARAIFKFGNFSTELSATSLLALETRMKALRKMFLKIPTLDPSKNWTWNEEKNCYETEVKETKRIIGKPHFPIIAPATEHHPAQTTKTLVEESTGVYKKQFFSAKMRVSEKADILSKMDELIDNISLTRSKANNCEVTEVKVMKNIFTHLLG